MFSNISWLQNPSFRESWRIKVLVVFVDPLLQIGRDVFERIPFFPCHLSVCSNVHEPGVCAIRSSLQSEQSIPNIELDMVGVKFCSEVRWIHVRGKAGSDPCRAICNMRPFVPNETTTVI